MAAKKIPKKLNSPVLLRLDCDFDAGKGQADEQYLVEQFVLSAAFDNMDLAVSALGFLARCNPTPHQSLRTMPTRLICDESRHKADAARLPKATPHQWQ